MYTNANATFPSATTDTFHHQPPPFVEHPSSTFLHDQMLINCMEIMNVYNDNSNSTSSNTSTNYSGYVDSPSSLNNNNNNNNNNNSQYLLRDNTSGFIHNSYFESLHDFLDLEGATSPFRRVYSGSDFQHGRQSRGGSPLSSEGSFIIESMSKACKYSPEEKRERIERYRSKRSQRNFNKKIKYECRKTLADSRPRIRGRFARNSVLVDQNSQLMRWGNNKTCKEDHKEVYDDNWIDLLDSFSSANSIPYY